MRGGAWVAAALLLSACGGDNAGPEGTTRLTLRNPEWDRVNVEIVLTKNTDCNNRGAGFISARTVVMQKKDEQAVDVPDGASVCWRHDRNPRSPRPNDWSGWSRATLYSGQPTKTSL